MSSLTLTLGTRGSALALAQADLTTAALVAARPDVLLRRAIIQTTGDVRQDLRLGAPGSGADKAVWTKELEEALLDGRIDFAVHSLKDVPAELPPGFVLAGVLPRADVRDVLISKYPGGLEGLPHGALIATSSVRRERLLRWLRPDLRIEPMRGNVPTRIEKLAASGEIAALVLAQAGLDRLRLQPQGLDLTSLDPQTFYPAASQGAVAFEVREEAEQTRSLLAAICHTPTWQCVQAERAFLRQLGAGCHTPVGIQSILDDAQPAILHLRAIVFDETSPTLPPMTAEASGPANDPEALAAQLRAHLKV